MPALLIDQRPLTVEHRTRVGGWEGDFIVGRQNRSAIVMLVAPASRYLRLVHLPGGHSAEAVRAGLLAVLQDLPEPVRLTLTWDQGSEMTYHDHPSPLFQDGVFFAHPGSPWQRGTNENTNRLLRQYFPKGTDLSIHTPSSYAWSRTG